MRVKVNWAGVKRAEQGRVGLDGGEGGLNSSREG